ncbi:MAG: YdiU family protein [Pseudomonadota bacterium]
MHTLNFDNAFTAELPADPIEGSARRQISNALFARVQPTPVSAPQLLSYSPEAAALIGLDSADFADERFVEVLAGNAQLQGMDPHATCYGGHQFGNWAGQLGDGRAINLGEVSTANGHWMLQLKGAGPTPFSRSADGLAVLRSSVREYLCSEAMYHLGVPTTRALSLVTTGEDVIRDMLYDGNPAAEPGAVVCRMSSSFVRFGHFQLLTARDETDLLQRFTDFVIAREFPHLTAHRDAAERYAAWFDEVCQRTCTMIVHWMRVGFVHGVMNTDNMSILGETIDYGPYGWLEDFDPDWTPNTTDAGQRRYRYGQQPAIAQWNLLQLANALVPLLPQTAPLEASLTQFARRYEQAWQQMMAAKLGLPAYDEALVNRTLQLLTQAETDMTLFYRALSEANVGDWQDLTAMDHAYYQPAQLNAELRQSQQAWLVLYQQTLRTQNVAEGDRTALMLSTNPKYVLRNYLAQLAIDAATEGDPEPLARTIGVLRDPYQSQPGAEAFAAPRPEWARTRVGCSMLSCSS